MKSSCQTVWEWRKNNLSRDIISWAKRTELEVKITKEKYKRIEKEKGKEKTYFISGKWLILSGLKLFISDI